MRLLARLFLCAGFFLPVIAEAKRRAPSPVAPVTAGGVSYQAPLDQGRVGYVEAHETTTGKLLWRVMIYRVPLDADLEADVQWIFIRSLTFERDGLQITTEDGSVFRLELKTHAVTLTKAGSAKLQLPLAR